ncbi:MAG: ankyrin repeat domain-containing protein [Magnetococcus sp. YQC-5]
MLYVRFVPLMMALFMGGMVPAGLLHADHVSFAATMLDKSPDPINQKFRELLNQNQIEPLRAYIASGVNINTADAKRVSPIHYAAYMGHVEALRLLINKGVDLKAAAFGGWSALHYAAFRGHVEAVNLLVAMGIPIDVPDVGGESPIFYAIEAGQLPVVQWLIEHGANLRHANNKQETPLSRAEHASKPVADYLRGRDTSKPTSKPVEQKGTSHEGHHEHQKTP